MPYIRTQKQKGQQIVSFEKISVPTAKASYEYMATDERVTSFRSVYSDIKGIEVPDFIMEPWAWFITTSTNRKREQALRKYGTRGQKSRYQGGGTGLPIREDKYQPVLDNGHAFELTRIEGRTNRLGSNNYLSTYGNLCKANVFCATGAVVAPFARSRMPFSFWGTDTSTGFRALTHQTSQLDVGYWSQKAIATLAPNKPSVDLTAFLGELLEGISIPFLLLFKDQLKVIRQKERRDRAASKGYVAKPAKGDRTTTKQLTEKGQAIAGEYVGVNFALLPLISDIMAIVETLEKAQLKVDQYMRDSHRGVRRSMVLSKTRKVESFDGTELSDKGRITADGAVYPFRIGSGSYSDQSVQVSNLKSRLVMVKEEKIWFSGSFTYYAQQSTSDMKKVFDEHMKKKNLLFGEGLTSEALWQLAPWSWLTDWFFDLQSSISAHRRMSDDSLVLNYGYLMCETVYRATQESWFDVPPGSNLRFNSVSSTVSSVRKERHRANPYGFGIKTPGGLNARQGAILTAIGITRL